MKPVRWRKKRRKVTSNLEFGISNLEFRKPRAKPLYTSTCGDFMDRDAMRLRTKQFALRILKLAAALPNGRVPDAIVRQLVKSGTSIGANYREALRASSRKHFLSIMEIALREADETQYWLELIVESEMAPAHRLAELTKECAELVAILTATVRSTRRRPPKTPP
jgi:four helix bundle protein